MNDLATFISMIGFPIAAAVGLSFYVVRKDKATQQDLKDITKTLTEAHERESSKLADVIERNTKALEGLARKIDKII